MREHIFKAKRLNNNEWVQGTLFEYIAGQCGIMQIRCMTRINPVDEDGYYNIYDVFCPKVNPNTICEFTGVNDKNDKMIFEGDIIRNHRFDETLYVRWDEEGLIWKLIPKDSKKDEYKTYELNEINIEAAWGDTPSYEIIGNIYD